jgi:hypothetical protein
LVVHVDTESRAEHATHPPPLIEACRGGEVGDDLLDVLLSAQSAVPPLRGVEARQVLRERSPFVANQSPEMVVPRSRHIARCPSQAHESRLLVDDQRPTSIISLPFAPECGSGRRGSNIVPSPAPRVD